METTSPSRKQSNGLVGKSKLFFVWNLAHRNSCHNDFIMIHWRSPFYMKWWTNISTFGRFNQFTIWLFATFTYKQYDFRHFACLTGLTNEQYDSWRFVGLTNNMTLGNLKVWQIKQYDFRHFVGLTNNLILGNLKVWRINNMSVGVLKVWQINKILL